MVATRSAARGLHAKFDEQNDILREIAASQREIAASQDKSLDIAASQNETLGKIAASQKDIAASQRNVEGMLRKIEEKITPSG